MEEQEGRGPMQISIPGTDKGSATAVAIILVMVLTLVFIAFTNRVSAAEKFAREYKARVIASIEESNREILSKYDLH